MLSLKSWGRDADRSALSVLEVTFISSIPHVRVYWGTNQRGGALKEEKRAELAYELAGR